MGFFSALSKATALHFNDRHAKAQYKKAKDVAFERTGKKIEKAKKNHIFIDGTSSFRQELAIETRRIKEQHKFRENLINNW